MLYSTAQQLKQTKFNSSNQYATTSFVQEALISSQAGADFRNLKLSATGTSALVTITADKIELDFIAGTLPSLVVSSVSLTPSLSSAGVNGLDTGTSTSSTWYSVWVISNGTTTAGLLSLSATTPTMPSGYTYRRRVGWIRTDATANKYPLSFVQAGELISYRVASGSNITGYPSMSAGVQGSTTTPTYIAISTSQFIPSTAITISALLNMVTVSSNAIVAPNNSHGAFGSTTSPPTISYGVVNGSQINIKFEIEIQSSNIYWANNGTSNVIHCIGWRDTL